MKKMFVVPATLALAMVSTTAFAFEFNFGGGTRGIYNSADAWAKVNQSATATGRWCCGGSAANELVIAQNSPSFSFGTMKHSYNSARAGADVSQTAIAGKGSFATNALQLIQNSPSWTSGAP
jgi:hypothetical protein